MLKALCLHRPFPGASLLRRACLGMDFCERTLTGGLQPLERLLCETVRQAELVPAIRTGDARIRIQ